MTVHEHNTVRVDLAATEGRCAACRLDHRPLWWVGRRALCATCTVTTIAPDLGVAVAFGTELRRRAAA